MKLEIKSNCSAKYVDYYLKNNSVLRYFRDKATGTAGNMPKINQKVVSDTPILVPTIDEQREIVRILDDLFEQEQQAQSAVETVLADIDTLKKSILARAFRGELATNDPGEESAVEMLKEVMKKG